MDCDEFEVVAGMKVTLKFVILICKQIGVWHKWCCCHFTSQQLLL